MQTTFGQSTFTKAAACVLGGTALISCASPDPGPADLGFGHKPTVAVTTDIWSSIITSIDCKSQLDIITIIPPGADPHGFELSLKSRQLLESADLVVANGLGLEAGLLDTLDSVAADGTPVLRLGQELGHQGVLHSQAQASEADPHDQEHHDEEEHHDEHDSGHDDQHEHGEFDPHIWFDPLLIVQALPVLAESLVSGAGLDPTATDECVTGFKQELIDLNSDVTKIFSSLPSEHRNIVTNHDSLEYLANRYDLEVIGTILPSSSTLSETNPALLEDLSHVIQETRTRAIFSESQHASSEAEALGELLGVKVVRLQTSSLGPDSDDYDGWLRQLTQAIADALGEDHDQ